MGLLIPPVSKEKVVQWWPMHEGSGDVVGYGGGTNNGATWVQDDKWMGDYALSGDGVDDYVETTNWGEFGSRMGTDFSVAFTLSDGTETDQVMAIGASGDDSYLQMRFNLDGTNVVEFKVRDGSRTHMDVYGDTNVLDGGTYRVVCNKIGNTVDDLQIIINGSRDSTTPVSTGPFGDGANFTSNVRLFDWHSGGFEMDCILDDVIIYGDSLTESEIQQDYLRQHWV